MEQEFIGILNRLWGFDWGGKDQLMKTSPERDTGERDMMASLTGLRMMLQ
jgi:hypothetical protein